MSDARLAERVLDAVVKSVDRGRLASALTDLAPRAPATAAEGPTDTARAVLSRILLSDILDESILGARPGETTFPLRMFFGELGDGLDDDTAFALANAVNFYFRVSMDEEAKMLLGVEVSRLYYRFARERPLEAKLTASLSPLLAQLMSTELERLRFEAVDNATVYDSAVHERSAGSDGSRSKVARPETFLCRVVSNSMVRVKAVVRT